MGWGHYLLGSIGRLGLLSRWGWGRGWKCGGRGGVGGPAAGWRDVVGFALVRGCVC